MPRVLKCACGATTETEKCNGDIYCNTCGALLVSEKKSTPTVGVVAITVAVTVVFFAFVYSIFGPVPEMKTGDQAWKRSTEESMRTRLTLFWIAATQYSMQHGNRFWSNQQFRADPYQWNIPPDFCFKIQYFADSEVEPASQFICVAMPDSVDVSSHVYGIDEHGILRSAEVNNTKQLDAISALIKENRINWSAPKNISRIQGPGVPEFTTYKEPQ